MSNSLGRSRIWGSCAVAAGLLFGTTACGSGSSGSSSGAGGTIQMWTFKQTHVKALEAAAAAFKQRTGITVQITAYTPDDTYSSKIQSAAATKSVADVLEVHAGGEDFVFGGAGVLADLAPSMDTTWKNTFLKGTADTGLVTDSVYKSSQQPKSTWQGVQKGQLFSVPFTAGTFGIIFANRSMLTAAGLNPAKPPTTWQQLITWLKAVNHANPKTGGITMGLKDPSTAFDWLLQPMAYADLGKAKYEALFGKDTAANWSSPAGQQVLTQYNQLTPYWTAGSQTLGIDDADRAFAQGKSAFDVGGTFTLSSIQQDGLDPANVVAFGLPPVQGGAVSDLKLAPVALTGLAISAQSKNQTADLEWLKFLTSAQQAGDFAKAALDLPGTDLGAGAAAAVGPHLAGLESVFGAAGPDTYNPLDSTFMGPTYDPAQTGNVLVQMSPLKGQTPASAAARLGVLIASTWK